MVPPSSGMAFMRSMSPAIWVMHHLSAIRLWSVPPRTGLWPRSCQFRRRVWKPPPFSGISGRKFQGRLAPPASTICSAATRVTSHFNAATIRSKLTFSIAG